MDLEGFALSNGDLLQQIATLVWINSGNSDMIEKITTFRVGCELFQRLSGARETDALRTQTIMSISDYVKKHPKASKEELAKEVTKQIQLFAEKVDKL